MEKYVFELRSRLAKRQAGLSSHTTGTMYKGAFMATNEELEIIH